MKLNPKWQKNIPFIPKIGLEDAPRGINGKNGMFSSTRSPANGELEIPTGEPISLDEAGELLDLGWDVREDLHDQLVEAVMGGLTPAEADSWRGRLTRAISEGAMPA